ncbi:MAG: RICIN domain-containing protein [Eubacteriales bacterium]|nr:RICIN domain-containing protein [Eubacteriales bacterium]
MRFPALNLSGIYPDQITSANVYIRDLMAQQDPMYVYCHAFYGNSWSESTANWSNVNPNSYGSSMSSKNVYYDGSRIWYDFSILGAVKDWSHEKNTPGYSGSARLSKGVIFKANSTVENGSAYLAKTFGSYNNGTTNYKPYLVLNYTNINYFNQNKVYQIINQGSGKYMQVDNKNLNVGGLAVLYGNSSESHIMWRFEMQSNGYCKIFPMHTNNLVLGVSTSGSIQTIEKTSTSDRALWKITKNSNGRYNIISKYFESVSNKYLAAQSSSYQIPTMHLSNLSADSLSEWNINAYNNDSIWDGEYTNFCGSIDGNPYQVYYTYDQNAWDVSVVDPWAVGTAGMTWNNISSNVNLIYDSPMYSYDDLPAGNNYFVIFRENNDLRNAIALTIPHFNNVPEPNTDSNWDFCIIECNLVKMAELTVAQRHAILVHELGHALKLSHPREITIEAYIPDFDYDYIENNNTPRQTINKLTFPSLMQPICGEQSIYNYLFQQISFDIINIGGIAYSCDGEYIYKEMSWSLTYYDKSALIQKWGE